MSLEEGSGGPPPGGFGGGDAEAAESPEEPANDWWGLRNTEPPVAPADVGHELDVEADWWQHMAAGFIKQSSARGTEAWMHYVLGVMILALSFGDVDVEDIGGDSGGQDGVEEGEWSGDWSERDP